MFQNLYLNSSLISSFINEIIQKMKKISLQTHLKNYARRGFLFCLSLSHYGWLYHNAGTCTWTRYPSTRRMIQYNSKPWDGKKTNKRHSSINRQKNHSIIFLGRSNTCTCRINFEKWIKIHNMLQHFIPPIRKHNFAGAFRSWNQW